MDEKRSIRSVNRVAYAVGDFYGGGRLFLVNVAGLTGTQVGLRFGISKLWDALSDPFMGWLSDRTRSRLGRRRIYFLIGLVPIFVSFLLIWYAAPLAGSSARFLYYLGAYVFFYTVVGMVQIPYSALSADMTNDLEERNALVGTRLVFSMVSTLVIGILAQPFIDSFHNPAVGHRAPGIAGGMILFRKIIQGAIVMPLLGVLLDAIGYTAGAAHQSHATLTSMRLLFVGLPVAIIILGLVVSPFFRMTPERHRAMVVKLDRLRAGGSKRDASAATRELCQGLTGRPWAELWRKGGE